MVIVMAPEADEAGLAAVVTRIEAHGGHAFVSRGVMRTIVGVVRRPRRGGQRSS